MSSIGEFLLEFCANTLGAIAALPEPEGTLEHMVTQENLFERTISFSFAHFAQSRVLGKYLSSLDDLSHLVVKSYPPLEPIPKIVPQNLGESEKPQEKKDVESDIPDIFSPPRKHSELSVSSVINTHLWDQAGWGGVLYAHSGPMDTQPPLLGLSFESKEMASSIFKEWNEKFGRKDVEDRIRISIIRGIDADNRHHYRAHVTQSIDPERNVAEERKMVVSVSRLNTMEPDSSTNLDGFLEQFEKFGMFFLVPAVISASGREPELLLSQSILRRNLHIRQAWEIEENDPDFVAIRNSDNMVTPSG
ncbi:hypothetical protein [Cochlodiniinecator piscidefendens]|uniref:hypothetical protein n=1 Tax=Cochlodiniinecator piscidefendens TaxID=2715756 RepID=UPI00140DA0AB|nr:hypothetical protein [Cochlodiniinecator piscidefendens]